MHMQIHNFNQKFYSKKREKRNCLFQERRIEIQARKQRTTYLIWFFESRKFQKKKNPASNLELKWDRKSVADPRFRCSTTHVTLELDFQADLLLVTRLTRVFIRKRARDWCVLSTTPCHVHAAVWQPAKQPENNSPTRSIIPRKLGSIARAGKREGTDRDWLRLGCLSTRSLNIYENASAFHRVPSCTHVVFYSLFWWMGARAPHCAFVQGAYEYECA